MRAIGNNAQLSKDILSIHFNVDGFSFSTDTVNRFDVDPAYPLPVNIERMLETFPELKKKTYKNTNIIVDTPHFTLVPFELYEDEQIDTLFKFNFPSVGNEEALCNILDWTNVALIFGVNKELLSLLNRHFPDARILSSLSLMTEWFIRESNRTSSTKLSVLMHGDVIDVIVCSKGKLMFVNCFECTNNNDRCYYILHVWQSLQLDAEKDTLELYTDFATDPLPTQQLQRFVRQVNVIAEMSGMTCPLKYLYLCE
ncbi:MAG: DUF3822 family protein [Bacteroidales bacterium]|nr:DUF3822 family protein [Bacteroidales bacterium]